MAPVPWPYAKVAEAAVVVAGKDDAGAQMAEGERRMGEQIMSVLRHYQQEDPVGLPGAPIPDPMALPDFSFQMAIYTFAMADSRLSGLSRFRLRRLDSDLARMRLGVALDIERLDITGGYSLSSWLSSSGGNFTGELTGVRVEGLASLGVDANGKLHARRIDTDLAFDHMNLHFENAGFVLSMLQGSMSQIQGFVFDSVKPYILGQVNANIRKDVNKHTAQLPTFFPNSISPFDMAVAEARKRLSDMGYDPFRVDDRTQSVAVFAVTTSHTWLTGLASFYRMGNITLGMSNATVVAVVDVGTQEIAGYSRWEVSAVGGMLARTGSVSFGLEHLRVRLNLSQPLDTRKRASLQRLDLELGNIQARIRGTGTIDYLAEAALNILPNLLRMQIMEALEGPIRRRIQDELDKVDIEKLIEDKIPDIEEQAKRLQAPAEQQQDQVTLLDKPELFDSGELDGLV